MTRRAISLLIALLIAVLAPAHIAAADLVEPNLDKMKLDTSRLFVKRGDYYYLSPKYKKFSYDIFGAILGALESESRLRFVKVATTGGPAVGSFLTKASERKRDEFVAKLVASPHVSSLAESFLATLNLHPLCLDVPMPRYAEGSYRIRKDENAQRLSPADIRPLLAFREEFISYGVFQDIECHVFSREMNGFVLYECTKPILDLPSRVKDAIDASKNSKSKGVQTRVCVSGPFSVRRATFYLAGQLAAHGPETEEVVIPTSAQLRIFMNDQLVWHSDSGGQDVPPERASGSRDGESASK